MTIKRYDVYYANLNPSVGSELRKTRPVVIVSQDAMNKHLETVVICPLTSKLHPKWRTRLQINCAKQVTEVAVDQIRTISKKRLRNYICTLTESKAAQLRRIITEMYGE